MESNSKKTTAIVIAIIIIVLIAGGFYLSYKKGGVKAPTTEEGIPLKNGTGTNYEITVINAKHQYKNGKHIYAGIINLPTSCHTVDVKAVPAGAGKYTLQFTTATTDETCAQMVTPRPFRVEFTAPKVITVDATLDGKAITLSVLEVKEGEDIDKVDLNFGDK